MNDLHPLERPASTAGQTVRGLDVRSIAKAYDGRAVLHEVSLTVSRGEVVGLLGPNGAGKTTSFYSVMGLVKPDSGRFYLDGEDITGLPMYRRAILALGYSDDACRIRPRQRLGFIARERGRGAMRLRGDARRRAPLPTGARRVATPALSVGYRGASSPPIRSPRG